MTEQLSCHKCHSPPSNGDASSLQVCSVCRVVSHCSDKCQKSDWEAHRPICTQTAGTQLLDAITNKDLDTIRRLASIKRVLNCRVDVYRPPDMEGSDHVLKKWTALHQCVRDENVEALQILIAHKDKKVDIKDNRRETPLFIASSNTECEEILKLLLQAGANPNVCSHDGWSALMMATRDVNVGNMKLLLEAGANLSTGADMIGRNSWHIAQQQRGQPVRFMEGETEASAKERSEQAYQLFYTSRR